MISLKEVNKENWIDCIKLSLKPEQESYLASNVDTIAESKFEPHHQLRAIYFQEKVIGMLAFCHENEPEDFELFWIFRFMIDKDFQNKGLGLKALELAIAEIKGLGAKFIRTMHKPGNLQAASVYLKIGFKHIGELEDGDSLLELKV